MKIVGWKLSIETRVMLLQRFPRAFPQVIADHVTLGHHNELPDNVEAAVVGYASDKVGLEALVVSIDGSTDRPDGSSFHITWSLDRSAGRAAIQSNDVIKGLGWERLDLVIPIRLHRAELDGEDISRLPPVD